MPSPIFIEDAGLSGGNMRTRRDSLGLRGAAVMVEPAGLSGLGSTGAVDPASTRIWGVVNTGVGAALGYASYRLWKTKHPVWSGVVGVLLAAPSVAWGLSQLATGKGPLDGLRRTGSGKGGTPDDSI